MRHRHQPRKINSSGTAGGNNNERTATGRDGMELIVSDSSMPSYYLSFVWRGSSIAEDKVTELSQPCVYVYLSIYINVVTHRFFHHGRPWPGPRVIIIVCDANTTFYKSILLCEKRQPVGTFPNQFISITHTWQQGSVGNLPFADCLGSLVREYRSNVTVYIRSIRHSTRASFDVPLFGSKRLWPLSG